MNAFLTNVLTLTLWSFGVSTVGLMVFGLAERKSAFTPLNAISHMFFGDEPYTVDRPVARFLVPGVALNLAAMVGWAIVLEIALRWLHVGPLDRTATVGVAFAVTVLAAVVDFVIVPKRFTPGFEHVLSLKSLIGVYLLLAGSLAMGGMMRV